jgi:hypothetical protein
MGTTNIQAQLAFHGGNICADSRRIDIRILARHTNSLIYEINILT